MFLDDMTYRRALKYDGDPRALGYGRFLQPDPIGYDDGLNWYNYVHGDPINGSDPSGMGDCDVMHSYDGSDCAALQAIKDARDAAALTQTITVTAQTLATATAQNGATATFDAFINSLAPTTSSFAPTASASAMLQNAINGKILQQRGKMSGKEREEAAEADEKICRVVNTRECWASAAERDAARVSGGPIPALQTGVRGNWSGRDIVTGAGGVVILGGIICFLAEPCGVIVGGALTIGGGAVVLTN